jgi:serine/threonine protein kinase
MNTPLQLKSFINKGTFGNVYNTSDNNQVYKCYNNCYKTRNNDNNFIDPSILRELTFLKTIKNKNIIKINAVNFHKFKNDISLGFTMNKYKCSLFDKIPTLDTKDIKYFMYKILKSLYYCHSLNIIHRDLKPANIMLKEINDKIKPVLIDFGLSKFDFFYDDYTNNFKLPLNCNKRKEFIQTMWYRSPEVFINLDNNYKMDIWSMGIIFYEMIMKKNGIISSNKSSEQLNNFIKYIDNNNVNTDIYKLLENRKIKYSIEYNKDNSIFTILKNINFDRDGIDLLEKMLKFDISERINCSEALKHPFFDSVRKNKIINYNFINNFNNLKYLKIKIEHISKINYNRQYIINVLKSSNINSILTEWIIYLIDYYYIIDKENYLVYFLPMNELILFITYLLLKFICGESITFKEVADNIFKVSVSNYRIYAYKDLEFDLMNIFNHNLLIKTPGMFIFKYYTYMFKERLIDFLKLENIMIDLKNIINTYLLEKNYYFFSIEEIYSSLIKLINKKHNIIVSNAYLDIINNKDPENIAYNYFNLKLNKII